MTDIKDEEVTGEKKSLNFIEQIVENDLKEGIKSVRKIAAEFGISNLLDKYPYELSGGEKQRTAICRAMIENPELILADEPTGNLDSNTSLQVIKTLVHINETLNKTVVMVTHDPKMASYGKRTLFLKDGVILDSLIKKESNEKYYEKIHKIFCYRCSSLYGSCFFGRMWK